MLSSKREWANQRVLVTGAAGFLGSHLVRRLAAEGAQVTALDRSSADLEDRTSLRRIIASAEPSVVFHLAGRVDLARTPEITEACIRENMLATANVLWALQGVPVRACIMTSTTEVYGSNPPPFHEEQPVDPPSPYAVSKVAAEHLCRMMGRAYDLPVVILRMCTVYGPGQARERLIPSTIQAIQSGLPLDVTAGEQRRDFLFVEDAMDGLLRAGTASAARGHTINLGREEAVRVREVIDTIRRIMRADTWQPRYGALPQRAGEAAMWSTNSGKAARLLGWRPHTSLEDGLRATIAGRTAARPSRGRRRVVVGAGR